MADQPSYAMSEKMITVEKNCSLPAQRYFALLLNIDPDVLTSPDQLDQFCTFVLAITERELMNGRDEISEALGIEAQDEEGQS